MNYAQIAAVVYQACNAYDPYLPPLSEELARAWGKQFEKFKLSADLLLRGVDRVYEEHGSGYRPLPKDISDAARAIRRDEDARSGPTAEYEALCDAKAGDREALARITSRTGQPAIGRPVKDPS